MEEFQELIKKVENVLESEQGYQYGRQGRRAKTGEVNFIVSGEMLRDLLMVARGYVELRKKEEQET